MPTVERLHTQKYYWCFFFTHYDKFSCLSLARTHQLTKIPLKKIFLTPKDFMSPKDISLGHRNTKSNKLFSEKTNNIWNESSIIVSACLYSVSTPLNIACSYTLCNRNNIMLITAASSVKKIYVYNDEFTIKRKATTRNSPAVWLLWISWFNRTLNI